MANANKWRSLKEERAHLKRVWQEKKIGLTSCVFCKCLSAFFNMSKTRFKRFSQQLNGMICIRAHIIYTFFVNCIWEVEEFMLLFFFSTQTQRVRPSIRRQHIFYLSYANDEVCVYDVCRYANNTIQLLRKSLNLVLDMWKKALKHSSSNRRNFKHFKNDETRQIDFWLDVLLFCEHKQNIWIHSSQSSKLKAK